MRERQPLRHNVRGRKEQFLLKTLPKCEIQLFDQPQLDQIKQPKCLRKNEQGEQFRQVLKFRASHHNLNLNCGLKEKNAIESSQRSENSREEQILRHRNSQQKGQKAFGSIKTKESEESNIKSMRTFQSPGGKLELDFIGPKSLKNFRITKYETVSPRKKQKTRASLGCKILLKKNSLFPFIDEPHRGKKTHSLDKNPEGARCEVQLFSLDISCIDQKEELPSIDFISKKSFQQSLNF